jgi:hypothetical protein
MSKRHVGVIGLGMASVTVASPTGIGAPVANETITSETKSPSR